MYKQYQQNEVQPEELDNEEDNLEAEERRKNLIVYGLMSILGLFIIFLLYRNVINKDTTTVIYKDAGSSNRVIKTSTEQITNAGNEQSTEEYIADNVSEASDMYGEDGNMSETIDLYEIAVENGFTGTREEFYELINNWNYSSEELERNLEKLQELIGQVEDGSDGEDGKDGVDGADGENGRDGRDGKDGRDGLNGRDGIDGNDGKDGKDGKDGEDGAFKDYEITSHNNNVFLFKTN